MPNRYSDSHALNSLNSFNSFNSFNPLNPSNATTMNTLSTSSRLQLSIDMTSSPSYVGAVPMTSSHTASSYAGSHAHFGSVAMAQAPSQMSNLSYQLSVQGSPTSSHHLPRQPPPYWSDSQAAPSLDEDSMLMDPAKYLQASSLGSTSTSTSSSPHSLSRQSFLGSDFLYASAAGVAPPSLGAPTDATSMSYDLSVGVHEDLFISAINIEAPDMVQIQSQQAFEDFAADFSALDHIKHDASADDCIRGAGSVHMPIPAQWDAVPFGGLDMERTATAASQLSHLSHLSHLSFAQDQGQVTIHLDEFSQALSAPAMERSATSGRSNQSARMREAARRHLCNAGKNQIQPKHMPLSSSVKAPHPAVAGSVPPRASPPAKSPLACAPNAGKMEISKTRRERPAHKRLFCSLCNQHKTGFRGPHELQRHTSRHHDFQRKRYICVDPRIDGPGSSLTVFKSLESCKHCRDKKPYGADYNAAAHLRRAHFKERMPRAKGRLPPVQDDANAFPVMEDLKHWIREITVSVPSGSSSSAATQDAAQYGSLDTLCFDEADDLANASANTDADADEQDPEQAFYDVDGFGFQSSPEEYSLQAQTDDLGTSAVPRQSAGDTAMFSFDEDFAMLTDSQEALFSF